MIWCDGESIFESQIHTNFKLSAAGERILISYQDNNNVKIVDSLIQQG